MFSWDSFICCNCQLGGSAWIADPFISPLSLTMTPALSWFDQLKFSRKGRTSWEGLGDYMGVNPKIGGKPPKWMVKKWKTLLKWRIWGGFPPIFWKHPYIKYKCDLVRRKALPLWVPSPQSTRRHPHACARPSSGGSPRPAWRFLCFTMPILTCFLI